MAIPKRVKSCIEWCLLGEGGMFEEGEELKDFKCEKKHIRFFPGNPNLEPPLP